MADLSLTVWADIRTPFIELNPIANNLLSRNQLTMLLVYKIGMTALGTTIFWHSRHRLFTKFALGVVLCIFIALLIRWMIFIQITIRSGF